MGYDNEHVGSPVVADIETIAHEDAAAYLPPPDLVNITPPSNYKRDEAIADYVYREKAKRLADYKEDLERCSLDPDLCRIVAIGMQRPNGIGAPTVFLCRSEADEAHALAVFWNSVRGCQLVGFNIAAFDALVLLRRSQLLGVPAPSVPIGKYRHPTITDLLQMLSFDWQLKWRPLAFYLRRFGIEAPEDPHAGADIAGLVAAGDWEAVAHHVRCDVQNTMALARRLGVITTPAGV